ncbi:MAG TPA: phosphoenolpyruvate synthase, partial [Cytophagales bacterium]|nr:phosphoenolpyruvate synthase [Cytophagales bacterium]
ENVVVISGAWGLGENVVQGHVNTDEFKVFKTTLGNFKQPIISRKLGSKAKVMKYVEPALENFHHAKATVVNLDTPLSMQQKFVLSDFEIIQLAKWGCEIEKYYGHPMDIEWAKDGILNELFIVQARP